MAPAILPYLLSALQLVSNLVNTGNSSISETTPGELLTTSNLIATENSSNVGLTLSSIESRFWRPGRVLPPGYVAHSDLGVAYKVHNETVSWHVAKNRCAREGARLAIIDSTAKIELVRKQRPAKGRFVHVGFHLIDGDDDNWYSVETRLPVKNLPWASGEPRGSGRCVATYSSQVGLGKFTCTNQEVYVCQIPYP